MSIIRDLAEGAMYLSPIAAGAALIYILGRDRDEEDGYDLWAAHDDEPTAELVPRRHIPDPVMVEQTRVYVSRLKERTPRIRPAAALTGPVGLAAWETSVRGYEPVPPLMRQLLIEQAVPTLSDAAVRGIAGDYLREIGEAERAKAGIRPVVSPATDRDFTGAFAVVAVA